MINNHVAETVNPMFFSANWRGTTNTDWATAGNWLSSPTTGGPTVPPTSSDNVFIAGIDIVNYPVVSTRTTPACNALNIASGGNVTVGYNGDLTVNGTLTLGTTSGGPIRVNSESGGTGSLITLSTITGTGVATAKVQRYLSANAWHLISAPISDAKANVFTDQYLRPYDEVNNVWGSYVVDINTALTAATGFACWPVTSQAYTYTGTLNTGSISASGLTYSGGTRGNNCVGNPYPSAIDWNAVSGWTKTNVGGSIWIWNQTDNAYGVWNGSTGTHSVNQYIPVGQGFFIQATGSPTLSMTNAVRVHNTQGFLKNSDIPNSLRLKVKNSFGTDEIVVYFDQNSSWIYDPMIDSRKMFGTKTAPQLYSLKPSDPEELSINVLPEIKNPTVVPVCLEIGLNDQYEITASQIESFPSNVSIILEDKKLDKIQDLRINPIYSFAADTNDVADRFNLHFSNYPYGINDQNRDGIQVYSFGKNIYVKAETTITGDARITVSDALGRNLYESTFGISSLTKFDPNLGQGYYIVRVSTPSGVVTEKLFIQ